MPNGCAMSKVFTQDRHFATTFTARNRADATGRPHLEWRGNSGLRRCNQHIGLHHRECPRMRWGRQIRVGHRVKGATFAPRVGQRHMQWAHRGLQRPKQRPQRAAGSMGQHGVENGSIGAAVATWGNMGQRGGNMGQHGQHGVVRGQCFNANEPGQFSTLGPSALSRLLPKG